MPDESASSGVEADDDVGPDVKGAAPPDTPSEDGHFNLDHLVNVVRSFQQELEMHHQASATIATSATTTAAATTAGFNCWSCAIHPTTLALAH